MKKPLLIVYSDIHFHSYNQFNEGDRRVKDAIKAQKLIKLSAQKYHVPTLFLGDLFQNEKALTNKLLSYTLPHFKKIWGNKGEKTYAITGNHDQSEQNTLDHESPSYVKTLSQVFPGLICMDFKSLEATPGIYLHGIPYLTHDIGLLKAIQDIKLIKGKKNILMLHTTIPGTEDTDGRVIETDTISSKVLKILKDFDLVITGHIHKPMLISDNILQVGATNQQRKTDKNCDLGYWIVYSDLSLKFIPLDLPKFIELDYGVEKPDGKNFYYNKEKVSKEIKFQTEPSKFSNLSDRTSLAENYLEQKGEKIKKSKKEALIKALKDTE
jgi:DNA repair exonuclease SbcCD nuclease subunit